MLLITTIAVIAIVCIFALVSGVGAGLGAAAQMIKDKEDGKPTDGGNYIGLVIGGLCLILLIKCLV